MVFLRSVGSGHRCRLGFSSWSAHRSRCAGGGHYGVGDRRRGSQPCAVPLETRHWTEDTEVADLQRIDVGIMPLSDSPWERGKCGLKLIQYMACSRPVVGSPVGVNRDLITDGVNGFKAATHQEWIDALLTLSRDRDTRIRMEVQGAT